MAKKKAAKAVKGKRDVTPKLPAKQASKTKSPLKQKPTAAKTAKKTAPKKSESPRPSKTKSPPKQKPANAKRSPRSPKKSKASRDFLKSAFSATGLSAIPLTTTGKPLKKVTGEQVIYGIRERKGNKVQVRKIDMAPQLFRRADLDALNDLVKRSATAQESLNPKLAFFQVKVPDEYERTPGGRVKRVKLKAGPLKGQAVPVPKTVLEFVPPEEGSEWRQLYYEGPKFSHAIQKNLQARNTYEVVKSEMLGKEGFSQFKEVHSRFAGGYEIRDVSLKGRTLTEALRQIQVPVSSLWLKDKKVILEKFRDNQIGNIFVKGNVNVNAKGKRFDIPIEISARYLTDLPNEIGRAIRQRLADKGVTFTTPRELAMIEQGAWRKLKALRGGLKSERARREMSRLTQPGIEPKSPKLKTHLHRIASGIETVDDFPLATSDNVKVNLRFSFYRDPLAKTEKKKKGKRKKK
jgi:hypothetical protein